VKSKQTENNIEDQLILNSLGISVNNKEDTFVTKLNNSAEESRKMQKELNNLAALLAESLMFSGKEIIPPAALKEKIFEKINSGKNVSGNKNQDFDFKFSDSDDWIKHPEIEGIEVKRLALNKEKGYLMILMKAAAGVEYPPHHHSGSEECYVLEGDLFVQGKYLGPGDFHHAEGGSDHEPLRTKNGCTLLLVVDPKDY
jgi:quercetin dioxygenase-like cupin family protein